MAVEITEKSSLETLLIEKNVVLLDFWAPWCGPCKMLGPIIDRLSSENDDDNVHIAKINVDDNPELASKYGVRGIPTMIFFKDGEQDSRLVGVKSFEEIKGKIESLK